MTRRFEAAAGCVVAAKVSPVDAVTNVTVRFPQQQGCKAVAGGEGWAPRKQCPPLIHYGVMPMILVKAFGRAVGQTYCAPPPTWSLPRRPARAASGCSRPRQSASTTNDRPVALPASSAAGPTRNRRPPITASAISYRPPPGAGFRALIALSASAILLPIAISPLSKPWFAEAALLG